VHAVGGLIISPHEYMHTDSSEIGHSLGRHGDVQAAREVRSNA